MAYYTKSPGLMLTGSPVVGVGGLSNVTRKHSGNIQTSRIPVHEIIRRQA